VAQAAVLCRDAGVAFGNARTRTAGATTSRDDAGASTEKIDHRHGAHP